MNARCKIHLVLAPATISMSLVAVIGSVAQQQRKPVAAAVKPAVTVNRRLRVAGGSLATKFKLAWRFKTGGVVNSSPAVADGRVYIGSADKSVYALRLKDGVKLWN